MDPITTDRLTLRPLRAEDAPWIAREIANPKVQRWLTSPPHPYQLEHAEGFIAAKSADPGVRAITKDASPIGVVTLGHRGEDDLGYWLAEHAWGQGYMTEAAGALLDWHFANGGGEVESGWVTGNAGSARVLDKLGFWPTETHQTYSQFHGKEVPVERVTLAAEHRPLFTLRTPRLHLTGMRHSDIDAVHRDWGDPAVARMLTSITPGWSRDQARAWLKLRRRQGRYGFGLGVRLPDGTLVGSVGLGGENANLGYMFGQQYWGQGFATEAVSAFLRGAYACLPELDALGADVYDDNPASIRLLERLGFTRTGPSTCQSAGRVEPSPSSAYRVTRSTLRA